MGSTAFEYIYIYLFFNMTSSGPLSPASNAQSLSHMHDDSEREIVLLGPTTKPCSLTDNEILGSPSGEVILNFHGSHQIDRNHSEFACGDKSKTDSKSGNLPLSAVQDQLNVIGDQLSESIHARSIFSVNKGPIC